MTEALLIDCAWTKPDPGAIKAAGYIGVLSYLSNDPSKDWSKPQVQSMLAHGLAVGLNWETTRTRATEGAAAGAQDGLAAKGQAQALGAPTTTCIFWSVDEDIAASNVLSYGRAFRSAVAPYRSGPYGSLAVVEGVKAAGLADHCWQSEAWSGSKVSPVADLYQRIAHTRPQIAGVAADSYDENVQLTADAGLWLPTPVPAPSPVPSPAPTPTPVPAPVQEDDMAVLVQIPNDPREWCLTPAGFYYVQGPSQRDDLVRLGVIPSATPKPVGKNTLQNLPNLRPDLQKP